MNKNMLYKFPGESDEDPKGPVSKGEALSPSLNCPGSLQWLNF